MDSISIDGTRFSLYREHFPWGDTPGYQSADGRFRFMESRYRPAILTPIQLADLLDAEYVLQSEAGIRQAMSRYAELRALPA